ncbi:hypothetical protein RIF29_17125 [Crotalaria pallida]|uniref:Phosphoinositide phospholipase C n=1 Tax=Crotalaria pallida TaxID=3830 RepID=A0AAN9IK96_CROPI
MGTSTSKTLRQPSKGRMPHHHFKVCFCFKRIFRHKVDELPQEISSIFDAYSHNGTMSMDDLYTFLVQFQGEKGGDATKNHAQEIFDSLKHHNIFHRKGLHIQAFFRYLLGDLNGPLAQYQVHHDMNAPLAHYFMYTGHNSYLTGNQLSSESSTTAIIEALQKGVRVIELDLWPNSKGNDVLVRHGGTLTSSVKLKACLNAIKEYAFVASDYPVVITFEDHITPYLQARVAKMVNDIFGEMLYRPDSQQMEKFCSPEKLKGKILISTKPPETLDDQGEKVHEEKSQGLEDYEDGSDDRSEEDDTGLGYRDLISIHAGKPKGNIENWLLHYGHARRVSLSEQELEEIATTHGTDIVRFTQTNLLRIYPKGLRVDSSNYEPMTGWMHGAQMVAFNMQEHDHFLKIMQGMFRANGGCGYVKKPDILLNADKVFDPSSAWKIQKTLEVMVYMGEGWQTDFGPTHFDLYSPPDFFVKVGIHGVPADIATKETRTIEDEWVPVWNEFFRFQLTVPELALLYIKVNERDFSGKHDFGGQTCLPVYELREGIRAVRLYNRKGELYPSVRLLIQFQVVNHTNA